MIHPFRSGLPFNIDIHSRKIMEITFFNSLVYSLTVNNSVSKNSIIASHPQYGLQNQVWSLLESISSNIDTAWLVVGDFNAILHPYEKIGGRNFCHYKSKPFENRMHACHLYDLGLRVRFLLGRTNIRIKKHISMNT